MKLALKITLTTSFVGIFLSLFTSVSVPEFSNILSIINSINIRSFLVDGFGILFCFLNPSLVIFYLSYLAIIIPIKIYNLILNKVVNFSKE